MNADPAIQHEVVLKPEIPNAPIWKFEVSGKGSLKLEGHRGIYTSPSNAGVVYDEMGKTLQAPALRTSLESPFWIDAIATGYLLYPLVSTFIVLNSTPTHYFNKKNVGGKLKLDFCYRSNTGEELAVEPDLTTWKVLAGDGRISLDGVFTPGGISRFSVISAIEQDPKRWYYAVIIVPIPMMTVDELVAL
ncbi:hypothetical protein [Pseudomonas putida]|uniref:Uncharacterized protein n=1 Tax=Pseudomonas putida TaxID=303 RepID=A0A6I6XC68_PSEPU|nr:hypothetical protein [Pseudomonas putida]QHG63085.2 hypothetical protein C2H86_01070 [Pseudomonas putida]